MSEGKHTPGPWFVENYGDDDRDALVIHSDPDNRICFMATAGESGDPATIEANAVLIAAAPATAAERDRYKKALEANCERADKVFQMGDAEARQALIDIYNTALGALSTPPIADEGETPMERMIALGQEIDSA